MRPRTLAAARYHASRMDPKDNPRIFVRYWPIGDPDYLVCANDVRPSTPPWIEIPLKGDNE